MMSCRLGQERFSCHLLAIFVLCWIIISSMIWCSLWRAAVIVVL